MIRFFFSFCESKFILKCCPNKATQNIFNVYSKTDFSYSAFTPQHPESD